MEPRCTCPYEKSGLGNRYQVDASRPGAIARSQDDRPQAQPPRQWMKSGLLVALRSARGATPAGRAEGPKSTDCVEKLNDGRGRVRRHRAAERVIGTPFAQVAGILCGP